jgi:PPOX class probable F420-dependent enzyme
MARSLTRRRAAARAGRPMMPKTYGVAGRRAAMLPWAWARRRLAAAHNYWLSTTRPDGRPHAMPIWALWLDETLLFSTSRRSRKGRNLSRRPQAVVHLESGDQTVILEGRVREVRDAAVLARYAAGYYAKYRFRPEAEPGSVTYALEARVGFAWRERDFPKSATRFAF